MKQVDLLIHSASALLTCSNPAGPKRGRAMRNVGLISDGAVAILDGRIADVGATADLLPLYRAAREIDASGKVVLPAFVDAHTHAVFAGDRLDEFEMRIKGAGYLEILAAGGGIRSTTRATREASLEDLINLARPRLLQMLALGAATVEIKTGYGLDTESELKMLRAIAALDTELPLDLVPTFMPAHAVPAEYSGREAEYVDLVVEEMIPRAAEWYRGSHFASAGRPLFIDVFCERNAFSVTDSARVLAAGRSCGMLVKAHVDEFTNLGGVGMALELGAVSLDHLDTITSDEVSAIAASETIALLTPAVNFNSGSAHFAGARSLIDAGAALALATDYNPGSAPCFSLPLVMAIACRYCRMTPAEALSAVTINAAHALGLGSLTGSIETGKQADLLVAGIDDYRALAYELGANPVEFVIKNGRVLERLGNG